MIFVLLVIILISLLAIYLKFVYTHWQRNGFPYLKPSIPLGNLGPVAKRETCFGVNIYQLYKQTTEPFVGVYLFFRPAILVRDAELVQKILVSDFRHFHDRGIFCNRNYDPMSENLLAMQGQEWKNLRGTLSPAFSSGKFKTTFPSILMQCDNLCEHLNPLAVKKDKVDIKDWTLRYALNIVASSLFGLDVDTIVNPNDEFKVIGTHLNTPQLLDVLGGIASFLCPQLVEVFHLPITPKSVYRYMYDIVKQSIDYRAKCENLRQDLMEFLIDLSKSGAFGQSEKEKIEMIASQVVLFYLAGVDTISSSIANCIFELARNPDMQRKLQYEIDNTMKKYDGKVSYESLKEMSYLDLCLKETIRKYPALPILNRECTEDYPIPNSKLTIRKGTAIIISLLGQLRDENYFPEPDRFIPDRFLEENEKYNSTAYIPFGDGPRFCIGARFGKLAARSGLVKLLHNFNFDKIDDREIEYANYSVPLVAKGGINVRILKRNM